MSIHLCDVVFLLTDGSEGVGVTLSETHAYQIWLRIVPNTRRPRPLLAEHATGAVTCEM